MNKTLAISLLALAICGCASAHKPAKSSPPTTAPAPVAVVPHTTACAVCVKEAPAINGDLRSPAWSCGELLTLGGVEKGTTPLCTEARVLMDDKNLYVAWRCLEKNTKDLTYKATDARGDVWSDDCVELYVSPDCNNYYHFAINCAGVMSAAKGAIGATEDTSWKTSAVAKASVDKNTAWAVTLCVPLKDLSPTSGANQTWMLNLNRTKPTGDDEHPYLESSWSREGMHNYGDSNGWGRLTGVSVP